MAVLFVGRDGSNVVEGQYIHRVTGSAKVGVFVKQDLVKRPYRVQFVFNGNAKRRMGFADIVGKTAAEVGLKFMSLNANGDDRYVILGVTRL